MKRWTNAVAGLSILSLLISACGVSPLSTRGSGDVITETRQVSEFDEILVATMGDVFVSVGDSASLTIEAEDNLMPLLTQVVRNGRLELRSDGNITPTEDIVYEVTVTDLVAVTISGSGDIEIPGLDASKFDVTISGSGSVTVEDASLDELGVIISGSGDVRVVGEGDVVEVVISGSGEFDGEGFRVGTGFVTVSGSGSVVVNASDTLDVRINGSGDVEYLGDPSVSIETPGSGEVSRR